MQKRPIILSSLLIVATPYEREKAGGSARKCLIECGVKGAERERERERE